MSVWPGFLDSAHKDKPVLCTAVRWLCVGVRASCVSRFWTTAVLGTWLQGWHLFREFLTQNVSMFTSWSCDPACLPAALSVFAQQTESHSADIRGLSSHFSLLSLPTFLQVLIIKQCKSACRTGLLFCLLGFGWFDTRSSSIFLFRFRMKLVLEGTYRAERDGAT